MDTRTLSDMFVKTVFAHSANIAYIFHDGNFRWRTVMWRDVYGRAAQIQRMLEQCLGGAEKCRGKRIALVLPYSWQYLPTFMAIVGLGATAVLVNPAEKESWLRKIFARLGVVLVLSFENTDIGGIKTLTLDPMNRGFRNSLELRFKSFARPEGRAAIFFTGGTTGEPKDPVHVHERMARNIRAILELIPAFRDDRFYSPIFDFHIFSFIAGLLVPMSVGAMRIIPSGKKGDIRREMEENEPTIVLAVPRLLEKVWEGVIEKAKTLTRRLVLYAYSWLGWWEYTLRREGYWKCAMLCRIFGFIFRKNIAAKKIQAIFGGKVRYVVCGGAPLGVRLAKLLCGLGVTVLNGYGLSQGGILSVNDPKNNHPETVGTLFAGSGASVKKTDEGYEIVLDLLNGFGMIGYADGSTSENDFSTGDAVEVDRVGRITISGRKGVVCRGTGIKLPTEAAGAIIKEVVPAVKDVVFYGDGELFVTAILNIPCANMDLKCGSSPLIRKINAALADRISVEARIGEILVCPLDWEGMGFFGIKGCPRPDLVIAHHEESLREIYRK